MRREIISAPRACQQRQLRCRRGQIYALGVVAKRPRQLFGVTCQGRVADGQITLKHECRVEMAIQFLKQQLFMMMAAMVFAIQVQ